MGLDERLGAVVAVDPGGVFEVGRLRVLMVVPEVHHHLVGPRVVVEDGDLDDPGVPRVVREIDIGVDLL